MRALCSITSNILSTDNLKSIDCEFSCIDNCSICTLVYLALDNTVELESAPTADADTIIDRPLPEEQHASDDSSADPIQVTTLNEAFNNETVPPELTIMTNYLKNTPLLSGENVSYEPSNDLCLLEVMEPPMDYSDASFFTHMHNFTEESLFVEPDDFNDDAPPFSERYLRRDL